MMITSRNGDQRRPGEDRHAHHRHAGARMLMIVTMKLKAPAIEATPRICRPSPEIDLLAREYWCGERRVSVPAPFGDARGKKQGAHRDRGSSAGQEGPVAEGVQPWEGNVARRSGAARSS